MADPVVTSAEAAEITAEELANAGDRERVRWYAEGGESCIALTERGLLVEPVPTFGPRAYRRIADGVTFAIAVRVAEARAYVHLRTLPVGGRSGKNS
jgi:uroporphyrinogen-III synthase